MNKTYKPILDCADVAGQSVDFFENKKKYISTGDVNINKIDMSAIETIDFDSKPSRANLQVKENNILFAKMKDTHKTLLIDKESQDYIYSTGFFALSAKEFLLDTRYLYTILNSDFFLEQKDKECSGATQKALNRQGLAKIKIPVPSLNEQQKISDEFDKIAILIEKRKEQLERLDVLVKSRFIEMFANKQYKEQRLSSICFKVTDGTHQSPNFINKGIPFLLVSNIVDNEICYETSKYISNEEYEILIRRTPIEIGDVLLTTVGSYGNPAVVNSEKKFCFQRHIGYIKPNQELVNSYFLKHFFLSPYGKEQIEFRVKGIAQKTLNLTELKTISVYTPPMTLQNRFADFVTQVDKSKFEIKKSLEKLETLKKSLMQRYFG